MIIEQYSDKRDLRKIDLTTDLVIVGGGMTGVCCAIAAARAGVRVVLIHDRPVPGGNASSEVRLWVLGATSHMGNNNRWSREGGIIDEILLENLHRNREGNPLLFDTVVLDKLLAEANITLLLNTVAYEVTKSQPKVIESIKAVNPQNSTHYHIKGTLFADCSGDGIVAYLAGVSYRIGAEDRDVYNEMFIPDKQSYGELLGHSIFFYTKETKAPVKYVAPDFALKEVEALIPRIKNPNYLNPGHHGCKYWWLEYGGRKDTVHDTEAIKYELWRIVYGVWDYIKNSGNYPETSNQTLEWVGLIPGKRESRRFCGYYTLTQQDVIEQRKHYDDVAHGGWSIDLHPSDGVYSPLSGCNQWHSKGVYGIPYRCYLTPDIDNLFLGGRMISASHVAHGSSRVMCTCSAGGNAIGIAAGLCLKKGVNPGHYIDRNSIQELQQALVNSGQYIPRYDLRDSRNKLYSAQISASSTLQLTAMDGKAGYEALIDSMALLFPVSGFVPDISFCANVLCDTELIVELRSSSDPHNFTPEICICRHTFSLKKGLQTILVPFDNVEVPSQYLFFTLLRNNNIEVEMSHTAITGLMMVYNAQNIAVSNYGKQLPPEGIGVDAFEFWCPRRWPKHQLLNCTFSRPLLLFGVDNLKSGNFRPVVGVNGWVASLNDRYPKLVLRWDKEVEISSIRLFFDTDFDQALENVQMGHHLDAVPQCVRRFSVTNDKGRCLYTTENNYQTQITISLDSTIQTSMLTLQFEQPNPYTPVALMGILCL